MICLFKSTYNIFDNITNNMSIVVQFENYHAFSVGCNLYPANNVCHLSISISLLNDDSNQTFR